MADFETLLSPSNILLYGRVLQDLAFTFVPPPTTIPPDTGAGADGAPPRLGGTNFLQEQLEADDVRLARIYGYSFEGQYYDLPKPAIFLVHGDGTPAEGPYPGSSRVARAPAHADRTGTAGQTGSFAEDIKVWSYDKGDYSIRLDAETGPLEHILLEAEVASEEMLTSFSGAHARVSGAHARISGAHARVSGAHARIRGNRGGD